VKRADLLEQHNTVYWVMERLQGNSLRRARNGKKSYFDGAGIFIY